jgi:predicted transcriptional regulator
MASAATVIAVAARIPHVLTVIAAPAYPGSRRQEKAAAWPSGSARRPVASSPSMAGRARRAPPAAAAVDNDSESTMRLVVMAPRSRPGLGARELAIMKVVWRLEDASVREVYETLRKRRPLAYTTVLTMMSTLEAKGFLKKRAEGRAFRYRPARPRERVVTSLVLEFVERVFDGASRPLLAHLVAEGGLTKEEREELKRLIDEAE